MASDAERARRLVADLLHLGRNCDVEIYSVEIQRVEALLAEVRLEEAKWWADHDIEDLDTQDQWDEIARERIEGLERAAGAEK